MGLEKGTFLKIFVFFHDTCDLIVSLLDDSNKTKGLKAQLPAMIEYIRHDTEFVTWWTSFIDSVEAKIFSPPVVDSSEFPVFALLSELDEMQPVAVTTPSMEEVENIPEMPPVSRRLTIIIRGFTCQFFRS